MKRGPIRLKCLIKGSLSHRIIKELKSNNGEMKESKLINILGEPKTKIKREVLYSFLYRLTPSVIRGGSKISVNKDFDFLVTTQQNSLSTHSRCKKYNKEFLPDSYSMGPISTFEGYTLEVEKKFRNENYFI